MEASPYDCLTFEQALTALEEVVQQMEGEDLSLDATLALFEQGTRLAARCELLLDHAQLRVIELTDAMSDAGASLVG